MRVPFLGPRRAVPVADFGVERINTNYFSEGRAPRGVEAFEWQRFMQKPESWEHKAELLEVFWPIIQLTAVRSSGGGTVRTRGMGSGR